jgi:hypothetical protein
MFHILRISKSIAWSLFLYTLRKTIVWKSTILCLHKTKRRSFPWFMFMMIMILILGRVMKKKRENQMCNSYPAQSLKMNKHHLGSVSLHQLFAHPCLQETFMLVVEPDYLPESEVLCSHPCLYPMKYLHPRSMYTLPRGEVLRGGIPSVGSRGARGFGGKRAPNVPRRKNYLVKVYCNFIVNLDSSL